MDKQAQYTKRWIEKDREHYRKLRKAQRERDKQRNPDAARIYFLAWCKRNPERVRATKKRTYAKLRQQILDAYGRCCALCGETKESALQLDHINGGGMHHKFCVGGSTYCVYADLRRRSFPQGEYQILCKRCNGKKGPRL